MAQIHQIKLVMIFLGAVLTWVGYNEFRVGEGASGEPQPVDLAEIEAGLIPDNTHLEIAPHWRMYQAIVFRYEVELWEDENDVTEETKLRYAYYPVLSTSHPQMRQLANLKKLYGDLDQVPEAMRPTLDDFAVLVKTTRYKTVGSLPEDSWVEGGPMRGLIINRIYELKDDEVELIRQSFPSVALERLLVFEEGRAPSDARKAFAMMGGGAGVGLMGIGWLFIRRRDEALAKLLE